MFFLYIMIEIERNYNSIILFDEFNMKTISYEEKYCIYLEKWIFNEF